MKQFIYFSLFFLSLVSHAEVRVAFLEIRNLNDELVVLEPGGRFAHVAVSYGEGWLHAYPTRGVEAISNDTLKKYGEVKKVIVLKDQPELMANDIAPYLGKSYDMNYLWSDEEIYSSELVAKLLGLPPEPMNFDAPYWPPYYKRLSGLPGLSPDDIHRILTSCGRANP